MRLLFSTVHGSHLYGLNHAESDNDYFEVYANVPGRSKHRWAYQTVKGGLDVTQMNLSTWLFYCQEGAHQSLEAMFSPCPMLDTLTEFRNSYRLNTRTFVPRYLDTAYAFSRFAELKKQRHALRLLWALQDGVEYGRFDPVVTPRRREYLLSAPLDELTNVVQMRLKEWGE